MKVTRKELESRGFVNNNDVDFYYKYLVDINLCISYNFTVYGHEFRIGVFNEGNEEINVEQLQIETFRELDMFLSFFDAN